MSADIEKFNINARIVRCPTCGGDSQFDLSNVSRPFCSPRCKNVDLGAWANEEFRVDSKEAADHEGINEPSSTVDWANPSLVNFDH